LWVELQKKKIMVNAGHDYATVETQDRLVALNIKKFDANIPAARWVAGSYF